MKRASPGLIGPAKKTKTAPEAKKTQPKMGTLFLLDWNFLWVPVETGNKIALGINPKFINWWRAIHSFLSGRQYQIGILITDEFKQERKLVKSINGGAAMYNYSCLLQSLVNELGDVFPELVVNSNGSVIFYSEYESLKLELIAEVFPGYHQENIVFITGTNFSGDIDKFSDEQKIVVTFSGEVDTHDFNSARQMISKEAGKIPQRGKTYLILDLDDSLLRRADSLLINQAIINDILLEKVLELLKIYPDAIIQPMTSRDALLSKSWQMTSYENILMAVKSKNKSLAAKFQPIIYTSMARTGITKVVRIKTLPNLSLAILFDDNWGELEKAQKGDSVIPVKIWCEGEVTIADFAELKKIALNTPYKPAPIIGTSISQTILAACRGQSSAVNTTAAGSSAWIPPKIS